jgi:hypothetical protein
MKSSSFLPYWHALLLWLSQKQQPLQLEHACAQCILSHRLLEFIAKYEAFQAMLTVAKGGEGDEG